MKKLVWENIGKDPSQAGNSDEAGATEAAVQAKASAGEVMNIFL